MRLRGRVLLCAVCCLLCAPLSGCESLQRKFTRPPKTPKGRPTPIVNFQDYTRTMTPLDRYRKHYLMFDYWNGELSVAMVDRPLNVKRVRRTSSESLEQLQALRSLVTDDVAPRFDPLIAKRAELDRQLQRMSVDSAQAAVVQHTVDAQARQIHREFYWRQMQDHLKGQE